MFDESLSHASLRLHVGCSCTSGQVIAAACRAHLPCVSLHHECLFQAAWKACRAPHQFSGSCMCCRRTMVTCTDHFQQSRSDPAAKAATALLWIALLLALTGARGKAEIYPGWSLSNAACSDESHTAAHVIARHVHLICQ